MTVHASFSYFKPSPLWQTVRPYFIYAPQSAIPDGCVATNEQSLTVRDVPVLDMRASKEDLSLDKNGFEVINADNQHFWDDYMYSGDFSRSKYTSHVATLLKEHLGAEQILKLSGTYRRRDPAFPNRTWGSKDSAGQPIQGVHVDVTPTYARRKLESLLGPDKADHYSSRRYQFLNTWQPLFGPLRDWPLGLLDCQSVDIEKDLLVRDAVYPTFSAESFQVFHRPEHRWYYLSDHMPNEMLIFKSYDSKAEVASFCPHAAFDLGLGEQRLREDVDMMWLAVYAG